MTVDAYDPETALSAYYPSRDNNRPARLWALEKMLHDLGGLGILDFFEGPGPDPTVLDGYASSKIWLKTAAGVTDAQGTFHVWLGQTPVTSASNWVALTPTTYQAWNLGTHTDYDYLWSTGTSGDPGTGYIGGDNATISSIANLRISKTTRLGETISASIATWDDSTNTANYGDLRIVSLSNKGTFIDASLTGAPSQSTDYWTLPVTLRASSGTLAAATPVAVSFRRSGNVGAAGSGYEGPDLVAAAQKAGGTIVLVGDSNTDNVSGRPGWQEAVDREWLSTGGPLEGWTCNNIGANGTKLYEWAASVSTGNSSTATTTRGNIWAAVNADPDIIVISLGTNDIGQTSLRSTYGTESALRTNLATVVNFCLENSSAVIWLRLPHPLVPESFSGTVTWTNADEAATLNARLRLVHNEWVGVNDRVAVYDSHRGLFGLRVDDKSLLIDPVDGVDTLCDDALHATNTGYRRIAERMARQIAPALPLNAKGIRVGNERAAAIKFAVPIYVQATEVGGTLLTINFDAQKVLHGVGGIYTGSSRRTPQARNILLDALFAAGQHSARVELRALYNATVKIFFPSTGTVYAPTTFRFNTAVTADGQTYDKFTIAGTTCTETGPALVYVENFHESPYAPYDIVTVAIDDSSHDIIVPYGSERGMPMELSAVYAARIGFSGVTGSCDVYLVTANSGSITGTKCASIAFSNGLALAKGTLDATNYPSGVKFDTRAAGTIVAFRFTNFSNFGGASTPGHVQLVLRPYMV